MSQTTDQHPAPKRTPASERCAQGATGWQLGYQFGTSTPQFVISKATTPDFRETLDRKPM